MEAKDLELKIKQVEKRMKTVIKHGLERLIAAKPFEVISLK